MQANSGTEVVAPSGRRHATRSDETGQKNRVLYTFCCGADYILNVVPAKAGTYNPRTQLLRRSLDIGSFERFRGVGPGLRRDHRGASGVVLQL